MLVHPNWQNTWTATKICLNHNIYCTHLRKSPELRVRKMVRMLDKVCPANQFDSLGKFRYHFFTEDPVGNSGTGNDLGAEEFVDEHDHHLLVGGPYLMHLPQYQHLCFLMIPNQALESLPRAH